MKRHNFSELDVTMMERRIGKTHKDAMWNKFKSICDQFDLRVKTTGGCFLTHEINCDRDDFAAILELTKGV